MRFLGCLALVAFAAVAGFVTKDLWLPAVLGDRRAAVATFDPVTEARSIRGRKALESLGTKSGPVFINLTAAEAAALVLSESGRRIPAFVGGVDAAVVGDRLLLRSTIDPADLKGLDALAPITAMMKSRQRVTLGGSIDVAEPGRARFIVQEVHLSDIPVPSPAISALVRRLDTRPRAAGDPDRAISFPIPSYIGDVRVAKGRVTLYKSVP